MKTVFVMVCGKILKNRHNINGTFSDKTFTADHASLPCSKYTKSLASEGEFL